MDSVGEDYFGLEVHTPATLASFLARAGAALGAGMVIVFDEYIPERVAETFRPIIDSITGATWEEVAYRVSSFGDWEFAGVRLDRERGEYVPMDGVRARLVELSISDDAAGHTGFSVPASAEVQGPDPDQRLTLSFRVQDPRWLEEHHARGDVVVGAGRIFAHRLDHHAIQAEVVAVLETLQAPTWDLLQHLLRPPEGLVAE